MSRNKSSRDVSTVCWLQRTTHPLLAVLLGSCVLVYCWKGTLSAMWSERCIALVKLCNCNNLIKNEHLVQHDILGELDLVLAVSFCFCVCPLTFFNILCFIIIRKQYWDNVSSLESQPVKAFYEPSHWWSPVMWSIVLHDMNHQDTPPDFVLASLLSGPGLICVPLGDLSWSWMQICIFVLGVLKILASAGGRRDRRTCWGSSSQTPRVTRYLLSSLISQASHSLSSPDLLLWV